MNFTIPPNTSFYEPDAIHQVVIQFPDADSAVLFYEWFKEQMIISGARPYYEARRDS